MIDVNTLLEKMEMSSDAMSVASDELKQMLTAGPAADVSVTGFGLLPSFAKRVETRVIDLTRVYSSVAAGQAAVNAGKIPEGWYVEVRAADPNYVDRYQVVSGVLVFTGSSSITKAYFDASLTSVRNAMENKGVMRPMASAGTRNNVQPTDESGLSANSRRVMQDVFLGFRILGARLGYYYRPSYFGPKTPGSPGEYTFQFEELAKQGYATSDTRRLIHNATLVVPMNTGIRTFLIEPSSPPPGGAGMVLEVRLDTDTLQARPGDIYSANLSSTTAYTWVVREENYEYSVPPGQVQSAADAAEINANSAARNGDKLTEARSAETAKNVYYGKGVLSPFVPLGLRNGVPAKPEGEISRDSLAIMKDVVLDVKITNADPGSYYRLGYLSCRYEVGGFLMQLYQVPKDTYGNSEDARRIFSRSLWPELEDILGTGVKTLILPLYENVLDHQRGSASMLHLTVDTNAIMANSNAEFVAWRSEHTAYGWAFDPEKCIPREEAYAYRELERLTYGGGLQIKESTRLGMDPKKLSSALLSGGLADLVRPGSQPVASHPGTLSFIPMTMADTSWDRPVCVVQAPEQYDYPLLELASRSNELPLDHGLFRPHMGNESGTVTLKYMGDVPMNIFLSGSMSVLTKVEDPLAEVQIKVAIRNNYIVNTSSTTRSQYIGAGSSSGSVPFALNDDFQLNYLLKNDPTNTPEGIFRERSSGSLWARARVEINGHVTFYPGDVYCLRIYRYVMNGPGWTAENSKPTDVLVEAGGFAGTYNARNQISKLWSHQIRGAK